MNKVLFLKGRLNAIEFLLNAILTNEAVVRDDSNAKFVDIGVAEGVLVAGEDNYALADKYSGITDPAVNVVPLGDEVVLAVITGTVA
jgi:hypothetical protein